MIAVRSHADDAHADGVERYEDVVELGRPLPEVTFGPEDDATILYTSGTTGVAKGAVSPHRAVVQALMAFGCRRGIELVRRRVRRPHRGTGRTRRPSSWRCRCST